MKRRSIFCAAVVLAASALFVPLVFAQPAKEPPPGFSPIAGAEERAEQVNASVLVVSAYGAILALMFGFVAYVVRSQSAMSREMSELAEKLARAEKR
jgi:hypothetical protein